MELRRSSAPSRHEDLMLSCVNRSWYNFTVPFNDTLYYDQVTFILNASGLNNMFRDDPGFVNFTWFNHSHMKHPWQLNRSGGEHFGFNFTLLNGTIFGGTMDFCPTPPPPQ